jgi:hypothetical protein
MKEEKSLLLYNPQRITTKSRTSTEFMGDFGHYINKEISCFIFNRRIISLLSEDNKDKKYYNEGNISPSMAIVLSQLFHYSLHPSIKNLYYKGKGYELLSLYFNRTEDPNAEQCPF